MIRFILLIPNIMISTTLTLIFGTLFGLVNPYGVLNDKVFYYWSKSMLFNAGAKLNVTGLENFDSKKGYIIVANHSHLLDIPSLVIASKLGIRFAAKKELFKIPVFGWTLSAMGMVKIDRSKSKDALKNLKKIEDKIAEGTSLGMFPEGTRNKNGSEMLPFKKGAFMMALNTGQKLLPVSINGSNLLLKNYRFTPGTISLHFHPVIDPADYGIKKRAEMMKYTRELIESKREYDGKSHT